MPSFKKSNPHGQSAYRQFASEHSLLFHAKPSEQPCSAVQGVAFSKLSTDKFLVQGASEGHDLTVLQRNVPTPGSKSHVTWTIMQTTVDATLPHLYIDGHRHSQEVYRATFSAFGHYRDLTEFIAHNLDYFSSHFTTYGAPEEAEFIRQSLNTRLLELIYHHGANLDYEMDSHRVRIYRLNSGPTSHTQLEDMFALIQNISELLENT